MQRVLIVITVITFIQAGVACAEFIDNLDGTVTDTDTGLMWQQYTADADFDEDIDEDDEMTWKEALEYCEELIFNNDGEWTTDNTPNGSGAKYNDWRLPSRNELQTIVDYTQYDPSINREAFPDTMSFYYWSSTTPVGIFWSPASTTPFGITDHAWRVDFTIGSVGYYGYKYNSYYVRAVRAGQ